MAELLTRTPEQVDADNELFRYGRRTGITFKFMLAASNVRLPIPFVLREARLHPRKYSWLPEKLQPVFVRERMQALPPLERFRYGRAWLRELQAEAESHGLRPLRYRDAEPDDAVECFTPIAIEEQRYRGEGTIRYATEPAVLVNQNFNVDGSNVERYHVEQRFADAVERIERSFDLLAEILESGRGTEELLAAYAALAERYEDEVLTKLQDPASDLEAFIPPLDAELAALLAAYELQPLPEPEVQPEPEAQPLEQQPPQETAQRILVLDLQITTLRTELERERAARSTLEQDGQASRARIAELEAELREREQELAVLRVQLAHATQRGEEAAARADAAEQQLSTQRAESQRTIDLLTQGSQESIQLAVQQISENLATSQGQLTTEQQRVVELAEQLRAAEAARTLQDQQHQTALAELHELLRSQRDERARIAENVRATEAAHQEEVAALRTSIGAGEAARDALEEALRSEARAEREQLGASGAQDRAAFAERVRELTEQLARLEQERAALLDQAQRERAARRRLTEEVARSARAELGAETDASPRQLLEELQALLATEDPDADAVLALRQQLRAETERLAARRRARAALSTGPLQEQRRDRGAHARLQQDPLRRSIHPLTEDAQRCRYLDQLRDGIVGALRDAAPAGGWADDALEAAVREELRLERTLLAPEMTPEQAEELLAPLTALTAGEWRALLAPAAPAPAPTPATAGTDAPQARTAPHATPGTSQVAPPAPAPQVSAPPPPPPAAPPAAQAMPSAPRSAPAPHTPVPYAPPPYRSAAPARSAPTHESSLHATVANHRAELLVHLRRQTGIGGLIGRGALEHAQRRYLGSVDQYLAQLPPDAAQQRSDYLRSEAAFLQYGFGVEQPGASALEATAHRISEEWRRAPVALRLGLGAACAAATVAGGAASVVGASGALALKATGSFAVIDALWQRAEAWVARRSTARTLDLQQLGSTGWNLEWTHAGARAGAALQAEELAAAQRLQQGVRTQLATSAGLGDYLQGAARASRLRPLHLAGKLGLAAAAVVAGATAAAQAVVASVRGWVGRTIGTPLA